MTEQHISTHYPTLLLHRKLDLLLRTGKMLMESLADTNRVVRNMKRVAAYMGIPEDKLHIDASYTMLIVNVSDDTQSFTKFQTCSHHHINMTTLEEVSKLSWRAIREDYSLDEYERQLNDIARRPRNYPDLLVAICAGLACGGFCKLFGCDWVAFFLAAACAFIGFQTRAYAIRFGINVYMSIAISACVATLCAYLMHFVPFTDTPWHPMLACALYIVPGVPLINFVDDMIDNYLMVGLTRALNTLLIVTAMSFGIVAVLKMFGIERDFPTISMHPEHSFLTFAVAAAISAVGFSMIFNIPRRLLWVVALGGAMAVCTRNFLNLDLGLGLVIGSFVGSLLVSLIAVKAVHWFHTPHHVLTIPMVIPMVPGVLMYRMLLGLINLNVADATNIPMLMQAIDSGIRSGLVIFCISLGVAIPSIFARKYIARSRSRLLAQLIEERKERGKLQEWCTCDTK